MHECASRELCSVVPSVTETVQVAIIGAGPVGLALAILLRQRGIDVVVLERRDTTTRLPQAHVINTRTMEILREMDVEHIVRRAAAPIERMRTITWRASLAGRRYGAISFAQSDPAALRARFDASPTRISNLAQNELEPILLQRALELGADVRFDTTASLDTLEPTRVTLALAGSERTSALVANVAVACDGAASRTRSALGIEMAGPKCIRTYLSIYFRADLERWMHDAPGPVHWILGSDVRGFIIGFDIQSVWAFMVPYAEPHTAQDFTYEVCEGLLRKAIGSDEARFEIDSIGSWSMSAQVAERFQQGPVFLAGDSAHRFPPTGGLGLNTGVQDAHNLAWKLAAVLKGESPASLLETYELERRPVAQRNCDQSRANAENLADVERAIGISASAVVDPAAGRTATSPLLDLGLDGDGKVAVAKRQAVAAAVAAQAEHFDFLGLDLGYVYAPGRAILDDGPRTHCTEVKRYVPSTAPGARLPHIWLERDRDRVSTVDLVAGRFTLLMGPEAQAWAVAAQAAARHLDGWLQVLQLDVDALTDDSGGWERVFGLCRDQALLVRPDGHVAWRSRASVPATASVLREVLGTFRAEPLADERDDGPSIDRRT